MDKIRWYELPEARQLASLGKKLSKAAAQVHRCLAKHTCQKIPMRG
jgi:hypothetical protein